MVFICIPDCSGGCGPGYTSGPWASGDLFGAPVPLKVRRYRFAIRTAAVDDRGAAVFWLAGTR
jgi:hypothetical protein